MADKGQRELDRAFEEIERGALDRVGRAIHWLGSQSSRKVGIDVS